MQNVREVPGIQRVGSYNSGEVSLGSHGSDMFADIESSVGCNHRSLTRIHNLLRELHAE